MAATSQSKRPQGPLAGFRIIDLTTVVFGPYASHILASMGADVIKVEPPGGDLLRGVEPSRQAGMGAMFLGINRNKRSIVLDLKREAARAALLQLLASADVFLHSMRPSALAKLRLGADDLHKVNPELVHVSGLGFGSGGPYSGKPAYDDIVQSVSGLTDLTRLREDRVGETAPDYFPTIIADKLGGVTMVYAVLAALLQRERSGIVQQVEVPMMETLTSFLLVEHMAAATFEQKPQSFGYNRMLVAHRRPLPTKDGHITILPYSTRQWRAFFAATGRQDMVDDVRVTDPAERSSRIGELYEIVAELTPQQTTDQWLALMKTADVPAAPVQKLSDLPDDPHLTATDFFVQVDQPGEGLFWSTAAPVKFSTNATEADAAPAPKLGEHGFELLEEAGLTPDEIADALQLDNKPN